MRKSDASIDGPHAQCPVCRIVMKAPAEDPDDGARMSAVRSDRPPAQARQPRRARRPILVRGRFLLFPGESLPDHAVDLARPSAGGHDPDGGRLPVRERDVAPGGRSSSIASVVVPVAKIVSLAGLVASVKAEESLAAAGSGRHVPYRRARRPLVDGRRLRRHDPGRAGPSRDAGERRGPIRGDLLRGGRRA